MFNLLSFLSLLILRVLYGEFFKLEKPGPVNDPDFILLTLLAQEPKRMHYPVVVPSICGPASDRKQIRCNHRADF